MDVRRYVRWPFLAVLAAVIPVLVFWPFSYASSGTAYRQAHLPQVIALIDSGQVRSARLIGDNRIQITTSGPHPQHLEASWAGNRGPALARQLQRDHNAGKLPRLSTVAATGGPLSSVFGTLLGILPHAVIILITVGFFIYILLLLFRGRPRPDRQHRRNLPFTGGRSGVSTGRPSGTPPRRRRRSW